MEMNTTEHGSFVTYPIQFIEQEQGIHLPVPLVRVTCCGMMMLEVLKEVVSSDPPLGRYEVVSTQDLRGRGAVPSMMLLKLLTSQPHRFATKDWLATQMQQEMERGALVRLDTMASQLRSLLCGLEYEETSAVRLRLVAYLRNGRGSGPGYQLAPYPLIWLDTDALAWNVTQAARMERFGEDALPWWERAYVLASHGAYLPDDPYSEWAADKRVEVEGALRQSVHALHHLYLSHHGAAGGQQALLLLRSYWLTHQADEDVLRPLMELLGKQERYQEAEEDYQQFLLALAELGPTKNGHLREPDPRTQDIREYLRTKQIQRQQVESSTMNGTVLLATGEKPQSVSHRKHRSLDWEETTEYPSSTLSNQSNALSTLSPLGIAYAHEMDETQQKSMLILPATRMQTEKLEEVAHLDEATFFGLQLAQAMTLIHQWFGMASFCHELQNRLNQEIKKLDQLKSQDSFEAFTLSRRSFLTTLATLPIALLNSTQQKHKFVLVLEEVLPTCAASITACWHLSGGGHLDAILPILDSYLPTLVNICKHTSTHREMVADLVAQIYFLKAILAWHLEGLEAAEAYCTHALSYSDLTKNVNLRLTALNQQALIAYYSKDFQKALQKSGEAGETLRQASPMHIFPIVQGRVYMYLAAIQAQQQLKEARQTLENARVAFSAQSALAEVVPLYADCGDASLLLWDGLTHYYLGQKDSKQARQALTSLSVFGHLQSGFTNPERFRLECLNNRTLAAIQLNDLEETLACFEAGKQGARELESKQRIAETNYAYQLMLKQWPTEKRVKQLQGANVEQ